MRAVATFYLKRFPVLQGVNRGKGRRARIWGGRLGWRFCDNRGQIDCRTLARTTGDVRENCSHTGEGPGGVFHLQRRLEAVNICIFAVNIPVLNSDFPDCRWTQNSTRVYFCSSVCTNENQCTCMYLSRCLYLPLLWWITVTYISAQLSEWRLNIELKCTTKTIWNARFVWFAHESASYQVLCSKACALNK